MKENVSKTNQDREFFNRRLDEIRMSGHERLKAKARFAQAEAIVGALFAAGQAIARLFKRLTARPAQPGTPATPFAG